MGSRTEYSLDAPLAPEGVDVVDDFLYESRLGWCEQIASSLVVLARAKGRVKTREQLVDEIRDREYEVFDRSVDVHISALRRKLHDDAKEPRYIRTLRAAGYMMIDPEGQR